MGMTLGGRETSGRVRCVGYGYSPDAPEFAKVTALDRERWQKALDGIKTPMRGTGYGYFPESLEFAKKGRCMKLQVCTLEDIADEAMPLVFGQGFGHGSPSPVDDIIVSIVA